MPNYEKNLPFRTDVWTHPIFRKASILKVFGLKTTSITTSISSERGEKKRKRKKVKNFGTKNF